jgi:predicted lipoprotein
MAKSRSILLVLAVFVGTLVSCSGSDESANNTAEDPEAAQARRDVLASIGEDVILDGYVEFEQEAGALEAASQAFAESPSAENREGAQQAWITAMDVWQRAEMFQIGPAGPMGAVVAGEDLRDQLYSWPLVNPCRVDQEIVEENFTDTQAFTGEPINVRGLDAMEYLLFKEGTDNECAPNSSINTDGSWDGLGEAELTSRRAAYAHTLASGVAEKAGELRQAWDPEGRNFLAEFRTAGADSQTYATSQEALNAVSDALFYLDKETKDMKLAEPAGLVDCVDNICPDDRESRWADRSLAHIRNNLVGFRQLLAGHRDNDESVGVEALLRDMGATQLADDLNTRIKDAIAAVDAVEGTMAEALTNDPQSVVSVYQAVKDLTDLFKSQLFDVLDLEVPKRGEGDND